MRLREIAIGVAVAALTLVGIAPAGATPADNTNSPEYWQIKVSNDLGGAPVTCWKDQKGSVTADGKNVVLNAFDGSGSDTGYVALIVKGGSEGEDGAGNKVYMFPNAGTAYGTPLNGGGQQAGVSHYIVCAGSLPVTYDVSCDAVTISYPQGIDSVDVNIRWTALPGGATTTQNYHPNTGAGDGAVIVVDIAATGYYSVDWIQVNGTNYHWQEGLVCGAPPQGPENPEDPEDPEIPEQPGPAVTETTWTGAWECDDTMVTESRTVTTTPFRWDGTTWVPDPANATVDPQTRVRELGPTELYACESDDPEDEPEVIDPSLDGSVTPMCDPTKPYLAYTIEVDDPDGVLQATTATLTFHHPLDSSKDWTMDVALGSGTAFWPGVTVDNAGTVVTWPGWYWDVAQQTWIQDPGVNYGWTTAPNTEVEIKVDPLVKTLTITYPTAGENCTIKPTIAVVSDNVSETPTTPVVPTLSNTGVAPTKAAAAQPVKAAATYAG